MADFKEMLEKNIWHSKEELDEVINIIKELSQGNEKLFNGTMTDTTWTWWKNPHRCKYISLRFDMRDGGFILVNDTGKRISLSELKEQ